jgi:hypothetical protein
MLKLTQLTALTALDLDYLEEAAATAAAPAWGLLPQLQGLCVMFEGAADKQQIAAILDGAAAATQLTSLQLDFKQSPRVQEEGQQDDLMHVCGCLAALTGLRELRLVRLCMVPSDALALTTLTGLTCLQLVNMHDGVVNNAATALARSLKQLVHLDLQGCSIIWAAYTSWLLLRS